MLNLLTDPWIPVVDGAGKRRVIAPWQMAEAGVQRPDWPRADLNIACLEMLIGLVFMADPPLDDEDWEDRQEADPIRLRERLAPFAPAFELLGEGPRFLQDLEPSRGREFAPDMLFIDSARENAVRENKDLMVHRDRYPELEPPLAAMALYTLQAHAPEGGRGNLTSMRGGGPMVTLVDPGRGLWPLVWANTPYGKAAMPDDLPWMQPTCMSGKAREIWPEEAHPVTAFFGMPRHLRLVEGKRCIQCVMQEPNGTRYEGWLHPLTPYRRTEVGGALLARHLRPGLFGYRHWLGVVAAERQDGMSERAKILDFWSERTHGAQVDVIVAGWAMKSATAEDFVLSTVPFMSLPAEAELLIEGMIRAAKQFAQALDLSLGGSLGRGEARNAVREAFFQRTQPSFESNMRLLATADDASLVAHRWRNETRSVALELFDTCVMDGLADRDVKLQARIMNARRSLLGSFAGRGKYGKLAYGALGLELPATKKATLKEAA